jgi:hypothetical protein
LEKDSITLSDISLTAAQMRHLDSRLAAYGEVSESRVVHMLSAEEWEAYRRRYPEAYYRNRYASKTLLSIVCQYCENHCPIRPGFAKFAVPAEERQHGRAEKGARPAEKEITFWLCGACRLFCELAGLPGAPREDQIRFLGLASTAAVERIIAMEKYKDRPVPRLLTSFPRPLTRWRSNDTPYHRCPFRVPVAVRPLRINRKATVSG